MAVETRITRLLGIEVPIIQGGMAWVAEANLAAAVSNAGGLGIIACGSASPDWVEHQIKLVRTLTDKPFGVNIMLMSDKTPALAELLAKMHVPVITTGAGSPSNYIDMWHEAGCKVLPVVASSALARRMERCGADAVIAEGCEAGGHIGELTTMVLTPAVCDAVSIPVVSAGGIADGRGMVAAFALGAEGVQMGTRFLSANECQIHDAYKDKIIAAKDSDTIVTGRLAGHPVRQLKNHFSRAAHAAETKLGKDGTEEEVELAGSLHRAVDGDIENGSMMSGQSACLVHERQYAQEIIDELMQQCESWAKPSLDERVAANANRAWKEQ